MTTVDDAKLHQLIGQMLNDLGGAASVIQHLANELMQLGIIDSLAKC